MSDDESYESDYEGGAKDEPVADVVDVPDEESDNEEIIEEEVDIKSVSNHNETIIVVKPEDRCTSNILSKYEMTEIISIRATDIAQNSNCMVDIAGLDDPIKMAKRELMMRMCPLTLRRYIGERNAGEKIYEFWNPNEMQFATTYRE